MSKNIVVIGASRGIGKELVKLFAQNENNQIFAFSRNIEAMTSLEDLSNVSCSYADISRSEIHENLDHLLKGIDQVDILVNNAGKLVNKPFEQLSREDIDSCYQTNAIGVMYTTQYFVSKMKEKGGHIVNISTVGAYQGSVKFPGLSAYSTSKSGVVSFTELFAEEYKETEIRMNCLCLGAVQTEMLEEAFPGYEAPTTAKEMASYIRDFSLTGHQFFNGKILQVSTSTP